MAGIQRNRFYPGDIAMTPDRYSSLFGEASGWFVVCVDACSYGRMGLYSALRPLSFMAGRKCVVSVSSLDEAVHETRPYAFNGRVVRCLVVRLPSLAREALLMLLQLSELIQHAAVGYHQVVVLSPFETAGVQRLVTVMGLANARVVDARLPAPALCNAVLFAPEKWMSEGWFLSQVLTAYERRALYQTLQFRSAPQQARVRQVSVKTIYSQRLRALMKLGVKDVRSLLNLLGPGKTGGGGDKKYPESAETVSAKRIRRWR